MQYIVLVTPDDFVCPLVSGVDGSLFVSVFFFNLIVDWLSCMDTTTTIPKSVCLSIYG